MANWESDHHSKELERTMKTPVELSKSSDTQIHNMHERGHVYADTSRLRNSEYFGEYFG